MLATEATAEQLLRIAHLERMIALRVNDPRDDTHADQVAARALDALKGGDAPQAHEYPKDEAGSCVDCDAAAALSMCGGVELFPAPA